VIDAPINLAFRFWPVALGQGNWLFTGAVILAALFTLIITGFERSASVPLTTMAAKDLSRHLVKTMAHHSFNSPSEGLLNFSEPWTFSLAL
jgi:hypothetical protein